MSRGGRALDPRRSLLAESVATGVAYAAGLCWAGASLMASFRPDDLGSPYWIEIRRLRTDTCGAIAFVLLGAGILVSEAFRIRRKVEGASTSRPGPGLGSGSPVTTALAETVAVLSTGLVVYLSVNAVTHPHTLLIQATHFATWPTEGTLRVVSLLLGGCSVAWLRSVSIRGCVWSGGSRRLAGRGPREMGHDDDTMAA